MSDVELLPWRAPEFHTEGWVSEEAKSYWKPKFERLSDWWLEFERLTISEQFRNYALQIVGPEGLLPIVEWCMAHKVSCTPIDYEGGRHRLLISLNDDIQNFLKAWRARDGEEIGYLLDYPECCIKWFVEVWKEYTDTCVPMVRSDHAEIQNSPSTNILLRDIGIRPIFHLPCRFDCPETIRKAGHLRAFANMISGKPIDEIYEILSWPIKYSALHSIAEITTPVFKLRRNTDYTDHEHVINYRGNIYPIHGASGIKFPFEKHQHVPLKRVDRWTDNGFNSRESMENSHKLIVDAVGKIIDRSRDVSIADLGCGNGELLYRIVAAYPNVRATGFDLSADKVQRAKKRLPDGIFQIADVTNMEFSQIYDIGLISINRMNEANRSLHEHIGKYFKKLIIYSYEENKAAIYETGSLGEGQKLNGS